MGGISTGAAAWLAWSLTALSLLLFAASVAQYIILTRFVQSPITWGTGSLSIVFVFVYGPPKVSFMACSSH